MFGSFPASCVRSSSGNGVRYEDRALRKVAEQGIGVVLIDGAFIPTQRRTVRAYRRNYSGKHRSYGPHFLALTDERVAWSGSPQPGPAAPTTSSPPATITSWLTYARPALVPSRTSASAVWTTTYATL